VGLYFLALNLIPQGKVLFSVKQLVFSGILPIIPQPGLSLSGEGDLRVAGRRLINQVYVVLLSAVKRKNLKETINGVNFGDGSRRVGKPSLRGWQRGNNF